MMGKAENARFLQLALFQGSTKKKAAVTVEMEASNNPALQEVDYDPCLFCTALKKNRLVADIPISNIKILMQSPSI